MIIDDMKQQLKNYIKSKPELQKWTLTHNRDAEEPRSEVVRRAIKNALNGGYIQNSIRRINPEKKVLDYIEEFYALNGLEKNYRTHYEGVNGPLYQYTVVSE